MRAIVRILFVLLASAAGAQPPQFTAAVRNFIKVDAPVLALTNVRVIDGTGAPAKDGQTIVIRDGTIADVGDASRVKPPDGATILDLSGKTVIPGIVMVHEHTYYPTGPGVYGQLGASFERLYLAGVVTTIQPAGNTNGLL